MRQPVASATGRIHERLFALFCAGPAMHRSVLIVVACAVALSCAGCATAPVEAAKAGVHPMIYSQRAFTLTEAQMLADAECRRIERTARLVDSAAAFVFDCVE